MLLGVGQPVEYLRHLRPIDLAAVAEEALLDGEDAQRVDAVLGCQPTGFGLAHGVEDGAAEAAAWQPVVDEGLMSFDFDNHSLSVLKWL